MHERCPSCFERRKHVYIQSQTLSNLDRNDVLKLFGKCTIIKPIHVYKDHCEQSYCHLHFEEESGAATFFYKDKNHPSVQSRFDNLVVKPARINGVDIDYDRAKIQTSTKAITLRAVAEEAIVELKEEVNDKDHPSVQSLIDDLDVKPAKIKDEPIDCDRAKIQTDTKVITVRSITEEAITVLKEEVNEDEKRLKEDQKRIQNKKDIIAQLVNSLNSLNIE